ncbi:hypothetical protein [Massilia sp. 9096]|uniref:hypothetical protein n=1 Tax=Massilia sp. 9096 TaxID=1500894 RepID=UPI000563F585|nr:hypothetical protein [Massilia sp. 9096]
MKETKINWLSSPVDSDYVSAERYLSLLFKPHKCRKLLRKLRAAPMSEYQAKDILRASRTPMSEVSAFDWDRQQQQIRDGEALGPILLVRQNDGSGLIIADGFHRMCALFAEDELIKVPCKIA